ncbi:MAG: 16S rRNA (guanine(966)-N(2))-methyltransferase RsmD [Candidatus Eisenbacteria bacterium]|uniref:16S rRNA (Guanine(966)-N(2))-methyltransferase RsmD n=1 Tax=Eiseniibacteriota bacterium TaxID=2212470 RepID=A0A538U493_UNCEI|nr:MAG: 16S rRNA (guanine(966)-N(2))-methyltransferase RsmD [Candidatus Eisenbacteria bacterium]
MRVIAGEFGGRRLKAPRGRGTRPTSDRVREALFMALEPWLGVRVVDLYAGSGALGIEALSRGALRADFVESDAAARGALTENLALLGVTERARVWPLALPAGLARLGRTLAEADIVLADPPYGGEPARATLEALGAPAVLREGARVVIEHHAKDALPERCGRLALARARRYGETMVSTYRVAAGERPRETEEERP